MLTDDARPTTDNDRCQPIAIGHLSESGDLKCDQDCVAITKTQIKTKHYTQKAMFTSMYTESFGNTSRMFLEYVISSNLFSGLVNQPKERIGCT